MNDPTFAQIEKVSAELNEIDEQVERCAKRIVFYVAITVLSASLGIYLSLKRDWVWGLVLFVALIAGEITGLIVSRVSLRRTRRFHQERQEFLQEWRAPHDHLRRD